MPGISFANAPGWLQWVVIAVVIIGAIATVIGFATKAWPLFKKFVDTIAALDDLPQFIKDSEDWRRDTKAALDKTQATLSAQDRSLAAIKHEVEYNNGSSVKDAIARVEKGVAGLYERADASDVTAQHLHDELEQTKPAPRRRKPSATKETP